MELQRMIARFVAEPAPFTQQALCLARRSVLEHDGAPRHRQAARRRRCGSARTVTEDGCCTASRAAAKNYVDGMPPLSTESPAMSWSRTDTSSSNLGHPTVAVLPALLAIGEEVGCSGRLLLEGFLIATEVTCKLGRIRAKRLHAKGWRCSSATSRDRLLPQAARICWV